MKIEYDSRINRFIITTPPWMLDRVRQIPNRRWDPRRRVWTAAALRANSQYLLREFDHAAFSPEAMAAANATLEKAKARASSFPTSYPFKTTPRQYQLKALDSAWGKPAFAYYMDMGTGKTKSAIDLFCAYYIDEKVDRVLIVTKFSTRLNWENEIRIHAPVETDVLVLDTSKPKAFDAWNTRVDGRLKFLLVGTESLAAGSAASYAQRFVDSSTRVGMVVDEAHMIKGHSAKRSQNCVKLGLSANYRLIMTGTPVANGPMDVFMQFEYLDPNIIGIGDFYSFRNRYAVMGGYEDKQIIGYQNMPELIELISPFVYQVRKSEVLTELPPKVYQTRVVELTDTQRRLYKQMAKQQRAVQGDRGIAVNTVLEKMLRLQEITGGLITWDRARTEFDSSKFEKERIEGENEKIRELLAVAEETDCSTIVWCRFLEEIRMVSDALREKYGHGSVVEIHGGVDERERHHNVSELFQTGRARFLVGNAATGGVGLNMTRAELVVYYSNSFVFTDREQSEDRAHRIGQTKSVLYVDLVAKDTVDEVVVAALREKKDVSEFVRSGINGARSNLLQDESARCIMTELIEG